MKNKQLVTKTDYNSLIKDIGITLEQGRKKAFYAINSILVKTYWEIGKQIVEYEVKAGENAKYGSGLFEQIAKDLRERYGKGFSRSNVIYMRLLYLKYKKSQTLSDQLSWSHYVGCLTLSFHPLLKNLMWKP